MPFDLSTAQPVKQSSSFDLSSAQPVTVTDAQGRTIDPKYVNDPAYQELIAVAQARKATPGDIAHAAGSMAVGIPELVLQGATGLLASASNLVSSLPFVPHQLYRGDNETDAQAFARNREKLTYAPRSDFAQAINSVVGPVVSPVINAAAKWVGKVTGNPTDEELTKDALNVLPAIVGAPDLSPEGLAESAAARYRPPVVLNTGTIPDNPVPAMRAAGFKLRPSDAAKAQPEADIPGKTMEKIAGSGNLRTDFIEPNQKVVTSLAAQDIGLPASTPRITPTHIAGQMEPHLQTYADVGQAIPKFKPTDQLSSELDAVSNQPGLSPPARDAIARDVDQYRTEQWTGPDAVKTISVLRRRAAKEVKSQDVNTQDLGMAHRQIAEALQNELERQAQATGKPELVTQLQKARTELAKINNVNDALQAGQVDPQVLNKLAQNGVPLGGRLKLIADAAEYAPHVVKHIQSQADVGGAASHAPYLNPFLDIATFGVRPILRSHLGSESFQNRLGPQAQSVGPGSPLGDYFAASTQPESTVPQAESLPATPASAMLRAEQLSRGLELEPDQVPNAQVFPAAPSRLTAAAPAPIHGDIPFTPSTPLAAHQMAGNLTLADDLVPQGGMRFNPPNGPEPGLGARQLLATQEPTRPMNAAPTVPPADLTTLRNIQGQPIPNEHVMPGSTIIRVGDEKSPGGFIAFGPDQEGGLIISRTTLNPELQGQGLGKKMLLEAANQAADIGKPLHSDTSVTVAQLRVYEALKKAGKLDFEYADPGKVKAALKAGDPRTTVKGGGSPVVKNIRPVRKPTDGEG